MPFILTDAPRKLDIMMMAVSEISCSSFELVKRILLPPCGIC